MDDLEKKLAELRALLEKGAEERKTFGSQLTETGAKIAALQTQIDALQVRLDKPRQGAAARKTISDAIKESDDLRRYIRGESKGARLQFNDLSAESFIDTAREEKTLITSTAVGSATSGVLMFERAPGVVPLADRRLFIRRLLSSAPTEANAIDYVKINTFSKVVSPQTEGSAKGESELTFTTTSTGVKTIATWIPATKQILDDFAGLQSLITDSLVYALEEEIEDQIVSGNNTGNNLNGLTNQATSFDTTLLSASDGWEQFDIVGRAVQQIAAANEAPPNFVLLHPTNYWRMRLTKDTTGRYIFDRPDGATGFSPLFGLQPIVTTAMTSGYFLVGSSAPNVVQIRNRMGVTVDISDSHSTYFTENKIAIRVEARLALVVFRPAAFIYGALNQSPA